MKNETKTPSASDTREALLTRVRASLGRDASPTTVDPPQVDESLMRLASAEENIVDRFATEAAKSAMIVHRCTEAGATAKLIAILKEHNAQRVATSAGALGESMNLDEMLTTIGVECLDWRAAGPDAQFEIDAGITDVHAAIAETGTIVCSSDASHGRGLSLIPPLHVALVRSRDVLPDMIDYFARYKGMPHTELPSSQAFITGPSKTADIEGELVKGVHGPAEVHIILLESN